MNRWNDRLCIGNIKIDKQHRALFKIAEKMDDLMEDCRANPLSGKADTEKQQRVLEETIKYLKSYAIEHFASEEAFQQEIGYKGYEGHKVIHDNFVTKLNQMEEQLYEENFSDERVMEFLDWFSNWLYDHIMQEDQKIKAEKE